MFRKKEHLQEKSRTLLKNKEIRGLRAWIQQEYPNLSECVLEETLPAKAAVTCIKLTNHTLLYSVNNSIYFYDLHGEKKVLFPSLLMLWKCPTMMRSMVTHGPVSRFVLRGADFMAPGLASMAGLEGLKKGEKVCLVSSRNPLPFAVGLSLIEVNGGSMGRQGLQGKAMQVLHYYGDCLLPEMRPNEGFTLAEILPVAGGVKSAAKSEAKEGKGEGEEEGEGEEREGTKPSENDTQEYGGVLGEADRQDPEAEEGIVSCAAGGELDETALVGKGKVAEEWEELIAGVEEVALGKNEREGNWDDDEGGEDDDENGGTGVDNDDESGGGDNTVDIEDIDNDDNEESGHEGECESSAPTSSSMVHSREAVDMQLERAVALAVRYVVKPAALPLLLSSFWKTLLRCHTAAEQCDQHPAPVSNPPSFLNIKHSTYRKPLAFVMHCAQQGLLTLESAGGEGGGESSGDLAICAVNREHVWVRRHKVASLDLFKQFLQGNVEAVGGFGKGGTSGGVLAPLFVKPVKGAKYVVQDLYKVPKKLREVVGEFTGEYGETLKISEVRELLSEYIKKEALEEGAKKGEVMLKGDRHSTLLALLDGGLGVGSGASTESTGKALGSSTRIVQDECEVVEGKSKVGGDDDEGYYAEETDFSSPSWGGGLALPPTLPSVPLYTLKIREGGLIDVHSIDQEKAKKPSTAEEDGRWKPVSLPPAPPPPTQMRKTSSLATQSASSSYQASKRPTTMGNKPKSSISSAPSLPLHDVIVTKEQFVKRLLSKMTLYYLILTPQGRVHIHAGSPPMIQIIVERRQGNKTVTLVRGLEHYDVDLAEICKKCQKKFACSVSVSSVPGIAKQKEMLLQGNFILDMETYLIDQYLLPRHVIEVKGLKSKKK